MDYSIKTQSIRDLLSKELTRAQFLKLLGMSFLLIIGVYAFLDNIGLLHKEASYGETSYGGNKKGGQI